MTNTRFVKNVNRDATRITYLNKKQVKQRRKDKIHLLTLKEFLGKKKR